MKACSFKKQLNKMDLNEIIVDVEFFSYRHKNQVSIYIEVKTKYSIIADCDHYKVEDFDENEIGCIVIYKALKMLDLRKRQKRLIRKKISNISLYSNVFVFGL